MRSVAPSPIKARAFVVLGALYYWMKETEIQIARQLVWLHGPRALAQAEEHADKMFALGDIAGFRKWNRIMDAIRDLERKEQQPVTP